MTRLRSLGCVLTGALLVLAQLHIWEASGCSMCGSSCRCASRASGHPCSVRSVGCGGEDGGSTLGSVAPLRAVLAAPDVPAPEVAFDKIRVAAPRLPKDPERPPLDRPPRVSS